MHFIDEAKIYVKAGDGGKGIVSFRREKYVPKGGPDGGNGGRGGSILIRADKQLNTLLDFKYKQRYLAPKGDNGQGSNKEGKSGEDQVIKVPCGTLVRDAAKKRVLADLVEHGDEVVIAQGGRGGKGNGEFATPTNQAPRFAQPGTMGEERDLILELKLLADVGLVGFPNAGKSTLIASISAAKPKIADYPFTTLTPNLGMVRYGEGKSFVVADIPGLIEGAHEGKGLGIQFLKHIERTKVLVFLIDCMSENPKHDYEILLNELRQFHSSLVKKKKIVVITKTDVIDDDAKKQLKKIKIARGLHPHFISAVTHEGVDDLLAAMWDTIVVDKNKG
ncbi:MAG TPA: GTPase ObgE [Bacteroidota bacterium]|nr:GTPase ObgE [Bacteroidota bacterium]